MSIKSQNGEILIKSSLGQYIGEHWWQNKNGAYYLTDRRIVFTTHSVISWILLILFFGPIGLILIFYTKGSKEVFEIYIDDILKVEKRKQGLGIAFAIVTKNGDYKILINSYVHWFDKLKQQIESRGGEVVGDGNDGFIVKR